MPAPDVAHTLFRIAQEALTNAMRHARARSVRVGLVYWPTGVTLLVQDDGGGFDRTQVDDEGEQHALGLGGMAERARCSAVRSSSNRRRVGHAGPGLDPVRARPRRVDAGRPIPCGSSSSTITP